VVLGRVPTEVGPEEDLVASLAEGDLIDVWAVWAGLAVCRSCRAVELWSSGGLVGALGVGDPGVDG
jgi:hypothetical protein